MSEYEREIGEMTARIAGLEATVSEMRGDLKIVRDTLNEARGSWRTLLAVAGFSSALGAILTKMIPFIGGFPK